MSLAHFSVSQIRSAATCPRIHYFDVDDARRNGLASPRSTLVWIQGTQSKVAGGALFHNIVERFNRQAARAPEILSAIERSEGDVELAQSLLRFVNEHCIDLERLATHSIAMRQAFITVMHSFFSEFATIVNYARSNRIAPRDIVAHLFGDARRRVDVTFHVGNDDAVHVTGTVDYVFYDWRLPGHRIVDYKLTPSVHANRDLFQVCTYALMHHAQHGTQPGVALFYLHPDRQTIDMGWERVFAERAKVYNLIASMVAWSRYDEASGKGIKPPGDVTWCASCKWNKQGQCEKRLGPKLEGHRDQRWRELTNNEAPTEPKISSAELTASEVPLDASDTTDAELTLLDEQTEEAPSEDPSSPAGVCGDVVTAYSISPPPSSEEAALPERASTSSSRNVARKVGPKTLPTPSTRAQPTRTEQRRVASAPAALDSGLYVGNQEETGAPVLLDPRVISTHIAVVGAAGSGKTWTAKIIAEEVVAAGVPVIAIDPQGDLVQFLRMRGDENLEEPERARLRAYRERVEPRIFTPGSSHGLRLSLSPIRLTSSEDLAKIKDAARRQEEQEAILGAVANNLVSLAQAGGEQDAQRTFLYKLLEAMPRSKHLQLGDVVSAIMTPEAYGLDEPEAIVKKGDRERLSRKLNSFVMGPAKNLFTGGTSLDLDRMLVPNTPGKIPLNVIYLNALVDDAQKHFFLAALAAEIYRWMVTSLEATQGRPNLLFYLDEARDFIPAGGRKPPAKEPLIRLFTQGRKYGVGCLLCTQSPRSVDYNVFGNCSTKIIGRMEAAQDVERIAEWFTQAGPAPDWIAERKGAPRGTFVGRWPGIAPDDDGKVFKGRALYSTHEGAWNPDRVEREVDASGLRDLRGRESLEHKN